MKTISAFLTAILLAFVALSPVAAQEPNRVVHVFVALADNEHQGIVPVPARLGNGDDPQQNLYWGAAFGVRSYFKTSKDWELLACTANPASSILERCIFKARSDSVYLVADAYRGREIRAAIVQFLEAAAGVSRQTVSLRTKSTNLQLPISGGADLVAYIGHDAFMDFQVPSVAAARGNKARPAIILACASRQYFSPYLKSSGATPLLWTSNLMAPEAYTLKAALDGWMRLESADQIRQRAAEAYSKYQKCSVAAARKLLVTGW